MQLVIISFLVLLFCVGLMAIGVLCGRKPITGSCGGVGAALGEADYTCPLCGGDEIKCAELKPVPITDASVPKQK